MAAGDSAGDWRTYGFRVSWKESPTFAGAPPSRHSEVFDYAEEAIKKVRDVMRRKPVTQRGTYGVAVVELQERVERREMPMGVSWAEGAS